MIFKIIAYTLIIFGGIFTLGSVFVYFTMKEPFDILIGWLFLGPLPFAGGLYFKKYMKSKANLTLMENFGKK